MLHSAKTIVAALCCAAMCIGVPAYGVDDKSEGKLVAPTKPAQPQGGAERIVMPDGRPGRIILLRDGQRVLMPDDGSPLPEGAVQVPAWAVPALTTPSISEPTIVEPELVTPKNVVPEEPKGAEQPLVPEEPKGAEQPLAPEEPKGAEQPLAPLLEPQHPEPPAVPQAPDSVILPEQTNPESVVPQPEPVAPQAQPVLPSLSISDLLPTTTIPEESEAKPTEEPQVEKPKEKMPEKPKKEEPKKEKSKFETAKVGEPLRIPPDAVKTGNLDFLEGCWQGTRPEYYSKRTVKECFCFGKGGGSGKRQVIDQQYSRLCTGATRATLKGNGELHVTSEGAYCSDGEKWGSANMICKGTGQSTPCSWVFPLAGGGSQSYEIPFIRVESCGRP